MENNFTKFHDKNYKKLLLIPALLLIFSISYLAFFYSTNNDIMYKDISLTGGTSITIYEQIDEANLKQELSDKLEDINIRAIYDIITQEKKATIIETTTDGEITKQALEDYLGHELNSENSSFEFTGSSLSESFFRQLLIAILEAFILMGLVVFLLFGENRSAKFYAAILSLITIKIAYSHLPLINGLVWITLIFIIFIMLYSALKQKQKLIFPAILTIFSLAILIFPTIYLVNQVLVLLAIALILLAIYFFYSIPSFAVILSAFADILMTLALVDILGIKMSSAGIVAFLMIIGYSVDTDILLTTRMLKRSEGDVNERILGAFKTGITMTLTSLLAIIFALVVVRSFSLILAQIFTILIIGLSFDLLNTWITNVSILKWYVERKK